MEKRDDKEAWNRGMTKYLDKREEENKKRIRILEKQLKTVQKRQQYSFVKMLLKVLLMTLPLWALFFISFETDISIELSVIGIILFFVVYFGTVGLYLYFKYRRHQ
ncbi:TPA: hypothetical protein HA297_01740 [Candidatus Woesearchaeota archaeon]|nr:hypothetical protein [Candidatus Woesearchaeota archaeon]